MTEIVFSHDGTVAKIVGDALHILFGAPGEQLDHATRAVACALAQDEYAEKFRGQIPEKGHPPGLPPLAVHPEPAIFVNSAGGRSFNNTATGEPINVAGRLKPANRGLGPPIFFGPPSWRRWIFPRPPRSALSHRGETPGCCACSPRSPHLYNAITTPGDL